MSTRVNPAVIGAFVVGAIALLIVAVLVWGGSGLFRTKLEYVVVFDSAVTGLNKGAPVLFRGVKVGEVTDIQLRWGTPMIAVYLALEPQALKGTAQAGPARAIEEAVREDGLRAQLRMQSFVTGVLYVALDFRPGTPIVLRESRSAGAGASYHPDRYRGLDGEAREIRGHDREGPARSDRPNDGGDPRGCQDDRRVQGGAGPLAERERRARSTPGRSSGRVDAADRPAARAAQGHARPPRHRRWTRSGSWSSTWTAASTRSPPRSRRTLKTAQAAISDARPLIEDLRRLAGKLDAEADPLLTSVRSTSDTARAALERAQVTLGSVDRTLEQESPLGFELFRC